MKSRHLFFFLAAGLCVAPLTAAQAQNLDVKGTTTGEGNAFFFQNVGIGTQNPGSRLTLVTPTPNDGLVLGGNGGNWTGFLTNLGLGSYNGITKPGDRGLFYTGLSPGTPGGGFVIAPWATGPSGLRMDESGNVAIGTSTMLNRIGWPASLNVRGEIHAPRYYDDDENYYLDINTMSYINGLTSNGNVTVDGNVGIGTRGPQQKLDVGGNIRASGAVIAGSVQASGTVVASSVQTGSVSSSGPVSLNSATVATNGFIGVGTTAPEFPLDIRTWGSLYTGAPYGWLNEAGKIGYYTGPGQGIAVSIYAAQRILTGSEVDVLSDAREKNILHAVVPEWAAEQIRRLEPKTFTWRDGHDPGVKFGFIAQEVDWVVPEAVAKFAARGYDDLHVLNYDTLYTVNVAATKHLLELVEKQQAELEKQRAELDELKARLGPAPR